MNPSHGLTSLNAVIATALLYLLPALLLLGPLIARRYPGQRRLLATARNARVTRRPKRQPLLAARQARLGAPRGSLLIACFLAVRPPPGAPLARS